MSALGVLQSLLRREVDEVDRGSDGLLAMRERAAEREAERAALRAHVTEVHPRLEIAVARRRRLL